MERVRRDERKAAEEEQRVLDRQIQAGNERRINQLRARADDRMSTMFGASSSTMGPKDVSISDETGHVNLFQDLEREERKNHGSGNKEYEAEKAQEKKEWESKMGIQVYFADNTNDLNKKKEWYEEMPIRRNLPPDKKKFDALPCLDREEEKRKKKRKREENSDDSDDDRRKKHKKDKKKKKKKKHHRDSSEERKLEEEYDKERKLKMARLRDERLKRERAEKSRTYDLLHPEEVEKKRREEKEMEEKSKKKKYNSQFNPEFFRK
ncbi:hypothetical protein CAEBREN_09747 [Caenorhabditis brenneri]|uniref:CBF1-interacting co-repressor CIR N-terminal domain-containing protein n=1 Tax=Caenorhabditis brenneri TaxID=135651 RepID=G0MM22_CAEBE|nr:hypothetical protein CAEBREN_09747 [Caenorhabditis brenneri]